MAIERVYVASSWRNELQPSIVGLLRQAGLQVYDFKHPREGDDGFHWSEIGEGWKNWNAEQYVKALRHPIADSGFNSDFAAMEWADACVLVLPCGRSAHFEAGYFWGKGKPVHILLDETFEPELMYKGATSVCSEPRQLLINLGVELE